MKKCRQDPPPFGSKAGLISPGSPGKPDWEGNPPGGSGKVKGRRKEEGHEDNGRTIHAIKGFSFLELLVTLALAGLLLGIVLPSSYQWICRQRLSATAGSIAVQLERARIETVFERLPCVVAFNLDEGTFQTFRDLDGDAQFDFGEPILSGSRGRLLPGVTFVHPEGGDPIRFDAGAAGCDCATFGPEGYLVTASPPFDPHAVYIGDQFGDFERVRVSFGGCVRTETWDGSGGWE